MNDLASRQRGLSLVELLVGLAAGIIFSLSVIVVQLALSRQNMQMSDVGQRDGEVRAALDLLTEDLSTSGFLLGGVQPECGAVFAYDSNLPTAGAFQQYPISATAQTSTTSLPTSSTQPTITAGSYVSAISSATTSMLSIYVAQTGLAASTTSAPAIYNVQQSVVLNSGGTNIGTSTSSGAVSTSVLPLQSTTGISAGSVGYLRLFFPGNNIVCFRAPATTVSSGVSITSSGGSSGLFPSTGYAGFNAALRSASVLAAGASLTNNNFVYGRFYYPFLSTSVSPPLQVIYYVGMASPGSAAGAAGNYPELMRATVNALTDALIGTPQPIAAGVVSLQALFGVDATNSGSVTEYQNWADVVSGGNTGNVRSVLFAIITKTLHADPKYSVPSSTITPASPSGGDAFQAYTVPSAYTNDRFAVYESEVAVRNQIWPR